MGFNFTEWSMRAYLGFVTLRRGNKVGTDSDGNRYYVERKAAEAPQSQTLGRVQRR